MGSSSEEGAGGGGGWVNGIDGRTGMCYFGS